MSSSSCSYCHRGVDTPFVTTVFGVLRMLCASCATGLAPEGKKWTGWGRGTIERNSAGALQLVVDGEVVA